MDEAVDGEDEDDQLPLVDELYSLDSARCATESPEPRREVFGTSETVQHEINHAATRSSGQEGNESSRPSRSAHGQQLADDPVSLQISGGETYIDPPIWPLQSALEARLLSHFIEQLSIYVSLGREFAGRLILTPLYHSLTFVMKTSILQDSFHCGPDSVDFYSTL